MSRELRGNVSITALEIILDETKRGDFVGIDSVACRCQLRYTHDLPCTYEIADYIRQRRLIPLDSLSTHWHKLDMQPTSNQNHVNEEDIHIEEFELLI